jgi:uncharacterized protein (TIGR02118 family)
MIRITVTYPVGEGKTFDHDYYHARHRPLLERLLKAHGLQRVEMDRCMADGTGGPPPVFAAAHLIFDSLAGFQAGMAEHGAVIMADIPCYTNVAPTILVSEMQ